MYMKTSDTTIQLRVDKKTKKDAQKTLEQMGLDFSSAIKLFLKNVIITQSIPFEIRTENGFTPAQEKEMLEEAEYALKYGKRYSSIEELHEDLLKEK
jgi:DNA-damage-inducible protein J